MLQLSSNWRKRATRPRRALSVSLADLRKGDAGIISRLDLPAADARRLMELGFLPGARIVAGQSAPGGGPRVFQVDGSEIALRRETQVRIGLQPAQPEPA